MGKQSKIAIIGGSGKMGQWFARFLLREGKQIVITGRDQKKLLAAGQELGVDIATNVDTVKWADIVLVAVSMDSFEAVIKEIAPYIQPQQLVIDITSIKELPVAVMHRYIATGSVLGTHPLFGPGVNDINGQNFVLTPTNENETALAHKIREYLSARGAVVTLMTPHQHDELMAVVLGLSHFVGLVTADTLASCNNLEQTRAVSGSTYRLLLSLVKAVINEDPQFYSSLQMSLPQMAKIEKLLGSKARAWAELVEKKDRPEFIKKMEELRDRLGKAL